MTNVYFNHTTTVQRLSLGASSPINDIFQSVGSGFDKLPTEDELKQGKVTYGTDTGAADAYVVALPYAPGGYSPGLRVDFIPANTNTGASTINVNGLGIKSIKLPTGSDPSAGDIVAGNPLSLVDNGPYLIMTTSYPGYASSALTSAGFAQEWANNPEDTLVSTAAGGDGVDDYSASHFAKKASISATTAQTAETGAVTAQGLCETARDAAQAAANGIKWKDSCLVATTANITLSGEQTIDGVLTATSRVLVKDQADATTNGVYVTAAGAWSRATPSDTWDELVSMAVAIEEGVANADRVYISTNDSSGTLGVTAVAFSQLGGGDLKSVNNLSDLANAAAALSNLGIDGTSGNIATDDLADAAVTLAKMATIAKTEAIAIACSDETTDLETGTAKATFRMPYAFTLTDVRSSVTTAPTGAALTVDINEGGTTILSTKLTIDATEKTSTKAATPAVISDSALADDAEITIDIDQIGSTVAGAGLKVYLIGYKP